jgi:hypothetical protein
METFMQILLAKKNKNFTTSHHLGSFFNSVATDLARKWILQD